LEKRLPILEPDKPHFLAGTAVESLPAFSRPDSMRILPVCRRHLRANNGLRLPGYAIGTAPASPAAFPRWSVGTIQTMIP